MNSSDSRMVLYGIVSVLAVSGGTLLMTFLLYILCGTTGLGSEERKDKWCGRDVALLISGAIITVFLWGMFLGSKIPN